jgi:hypothetical protein
VEEGLDKTYLNCRDYQCVTDRMNVTFTVRAEHKGRMANKAARNAARNAQNTKISELWCVFYHSRRGEGYGGPQQTPSRACTVLFCASI